MLMMTLIHTSRPFDSKPPSTRMRVGEQGRAVLIVCVNADVRTRENRVPAATTAWDQPSHPFQTAKTSAGLQLKKHLIESNISSPSLVTRKDVYGTYLQSGTNCYFCMKISSLYFKLTTAASLLIASNSRLERACTIRRGFFWSFAAQSR